MGAPTPHRQNPRPWPRGSPRAWTRTRTSRQPASRPTPDAGVAWTRMDLTENIGGQLTPRTPVSSIIIDLLEGSPSIMVGYAGESGAHTFWCAADNGRA